MGSLPSASTLPNLYLVGFMGTGKSSVGKQIAKALNFQFIDSDSAIESSSDLSVCQIFQNFGESHFRQLESDFIENGHPPHNTVIACGGGLLQSTGMLQILQQKGVVITLSASPETILARTQHRTTRPLLNVDDKLQRIRDLLQERLPTYLKAGPSIMTDSRPLPDVVRHVLRIYQREVEIKNGSLSRT